MSDRRASRRRGKNLIWDGRHETLGHWLIIESIATIGRGNLRQGFISAAYVQTGVGRGAMIFIMHNTIHMNAIDGIRRAKPFRVLILEWITVPMGQINGITILRKIVECAAGKGEIETSGDEHMNQPVRISKKHYGGIGAVDLRFWRLVLHRRCLTMESRIWKKELSITTGN